MLLGEALGAAMPMTTIEFIDRFGLCAVSMHLEPTYFDFPTIASMLNMLPVRKLGNLELKPLNRSERVNVHTMKRVSKYITFEKLVSKHRHDGTGNCDAGKGAHT